MPATPATGVPSSVPAKYRQYVADAARALGIPASVVAAQIGLESAWNPNAKSPAGAEGIAQFMPGTFKEYGSGSPYNVDDAFAAYTAYMKQLLKTEGGDIRKALQAYNAGPGNLPAGAGYADTILKRAGSGGGSADAGETASAPVDAGSGGGGLLSWPGEITGFFQTAYSDLSSTADFFAAFFQPSTYVRIGAGFWGIVFVILGIVCLARESQGA
jgi:membrane-bound lytic murein transglycosylase B